MNSLAWGRCDQQCSHPRLVIKPLCPSYTGKEPLLHMHFHRHELFEPFGFICHTSKESCHMWSLADMKASAGAAAVKCFIRGADGAR